MTSLLGKLGMAAARGTMTGVGLGARVGMEAAGVAAHIGISTAVSSARAAVSTATALGSVGFRVGRAGLRFLGRGKMPMEFATLPLPRGRSLSIPHQLNRAATNTVVGGAFAGAAALGAIDHFRNQQWNLHQAVSTGQVEIEKPHFLGATGSLTIATYNHRRRMKGDPNLIPDFSQYSSQAIRAAHIIL